MAILIINSEDFTQELKGFSITCKKCNGNNVEFEIDWAAYPSASWFNVTTICKDCHYDETIYETN